MLVVVNHVHFTIHFNVFRGGKKKKPCMGT